MKDLMIGPHAIRRDGDMWCITDLWKAAGAPKEKRPNDFLAGHGKAFAEFLSDSLDTGKSGIVKTRRIAGSTPGGETWTHWQLALAYAKWISHEFHARVNDVYRAFISGELAVRDPEAIRLALRIERLDSADYESAWDTELKLELARLRKVVGWTPGPGNGSEPQAMALAYGKTWRIILGDASTTSSSSETRTRATAACTASGSATSDSVSSDGRTWW